MKEWIAAVLENRPGEDWKRLSNVAFGAWLVFFLGFLWYAAKSDEDFLFLDRLNLVVHEGGHPLFSFFGETMMILGGTLLELIVPLGIAIYFWWHRHTAGVAFCSFWFFENFLYIGTYMADARRLTLPLVGSGDHDWEILFSQWGVLHLDQKIGGWTRTLGWWGMGLTVVWLVWMWRRTASSESRHQTFSR
ncbi:MAG: hypothetical protein M1453_05725 [Acidobacteria bacterium]|nr:hypothetical protein [Acidobacteriota bacterium]